MSLVCLNIRLGMLCMACESLNSCVDRPLVQTIVDPHVKNPTMKHQPQNVLEDSGAAIFAVLILPLIPASFLAVGIYFLLNCLIS